MIVETEAYGRDDPASHGLRAKYKKPINARSHGRSYIYRICGLCWYTNFVCANASTVLFHAIAPLAGTDLMKQRRNTNRITELCSGTVTCLAYLGLFPKPSRVLARFVSRNRGLHYRPIAAR
ncbi:DNA-3-methyladenine glycosylase [Brucella pseudogrignonensis]|nr:DNA-3-methyladenine glycosylase [Brucella pseudogrignonensis]